MLENGLGHGNREQLETRVTIGLVAERRQADVDPSVVAALGVDIEDPHRPAAHGGSEVGTAARLPVQPDDLDHSHQAAVVRRRRPNLSALTSVAYCRGQPRVRAVQYRCAGPPSSTSKLRALPPPD